MQTQTITGSIFISPNSNDFAESKECRNQIHPDLKPYLDSVDGRYYQSVSEAINSVKKNFISAQEIQKVEFLRLMTENEHYESEGERIEFCDVCEGNYNYIDFSSSPVNLDDKRKNETGVQLLKSRPWLKTKVMKEKYDELIVGHCSWCNTLHFICAECSTVNSVMENEYDEPKECEGGVWITLSC
jgi:hypothetical protein